jgi:hypothetical protein
MVYIPMNSGNYINDTKKIIYLKNEKADIGGGTIIISDRDVPYKKAIYNDIS